MITTFKHKGLERFFVSGCAKGIPAIYAARIERLLDRLDSAAEPNDMNVIGYRFHRLKGARRSQYSVWVSANWRLVFMFEAGDAINVNLEDYH